MGVADAGLIGENGEEEGKVRGRGQYGAITLGQGELMASRTRAEAPGIERQLKRQRWGDRERQRQREGDKETQRQR